MHSILRYVLFLQIVQDNDIMHTYTLLFRFETAIYISLSCIQVFFLSYLKVMSSYIVT